MVGRMMRDLNLDFVQAEDATTKSKWAMNYKEYAKKWAWENDGYSDACKCNYRCPVHTKQSLMKHGYGKEVNCPIVTA